MLVEVFNDRAMQEVILYNPACMHCQRCGAQGRRSATDADASSPLPQETRRNNLPYTVESLQLLDRRSTTMNARISVPVFIFHNLRVDLERRASGFGAAPSHRAFGALPPASSCPQSAVLVVLSAVPGKKSD